VTASVDALSPRQRDVLQLVAKGLTNGEIGSALGISAETVRTHVTSILARLQVSNRTEAVAAYLAWDAGVDRVAKVLDRPAIAVLPIVAIDGAAHAAAVGAGITRDLVALFSRWCWFPVIANASTCDARALGDTSQAVGRALGARFLVDGALRSAGPRFRLDIAIVDAPDAACVWAGAYDFDREGLFEVQDTVCRAVVAAAYPTIIASVHAGLSRARPSADFAAWELAHQGFLLQGARERESNRRAQAAFGAAIEREPGLVLAHFGLGLAAYDEVLNQWGPERPALDRLAGCAERCMDLAPQMAEGYYLSGRRCQALGKHDQARQPLETAIGHNPSFAAAHALLGQVLLLTGRGDEGLGRMKHACRLGPRAFVAGLAVAHFARGEHPEALEAAERAIAVTPRYPFARALAAACAWILGDREAASAHARAFVAMQPGFTPATFARTFGADVDAVSRFVGALEDACRHAAGAITPSRAERPRLAIAPRASSCLASCTRSA
jgi:TolB-like protein